jgi:hypothetical protein
MNELREQRMSMCKTSATLAVRDYARAGGKPDVATAVRAMLRQRGNPKSLSVTGSGSPDVTQE